MPGSQVNDLSIIKQKVEVNFTTINTVDGSTFSEVHTISGPTGSGIAPISNPTLGPIKLVVPLNFAAGNGAPVLKIWMPDPTNFPSKMYITYAVKNSNMTDDYYDYTQDGLPTSYKDALATWIRNGATATGVRTRDLNFSVWGVDTNQISSAKAFKVRFRWDFGGGFTSGDLLVDFAPSF